MFPARSGSVGPLVSRTDAFLDADVAGIVPGRVSLDASLPAPSQEVSRHVGRGCGTGPCEQAGRNHTNTTTGEVEKRWRPFSPAALVRLLHQQPSLPELSSLPRSMLMQQGPSAQPLPSSLPPPAASRASAFPPFPPRPLRRHAVDAPWRTVLSTPLVLFLLPALPTSWPKSPAARLESHAMLRPPQTGWV